MPDLTEYYTKVRQGNLKLAKDRYKGVFRHRALMFIRGQGTTALVDEEICMGCTHCFDNCAFEAIGMEERKFALPDYVYASRKARIIVDNCVGCEKCAIVCPVDAITMLPKQGFSVQDGRLVAAPTVEAKPMARPAPPAAGSGG